MTFRLSLLLCFLSFLLADCKAPGDKQKAAEVPTAAEVSKGQEVSKAAEEVSVAMDVDVKQFKQLMQDPNRIILDVRTPEETADGIIPGAIQIDYRAEGFEDKINALDKNKEYLVYCRSGGRSGKTASIMKDQGFSKIYNLAGGYIAWSDK